MEYEKLVKKFKVMHPIRKHYLAQLIILTSLLEEGGEFTINGLVNIKKLRTTEKGFEFSVETDLNWNDLVQLIKDNYK